MNLCYILVITIFAILIIPSFSVDDANINIFSWSKNFPRKQPQQLVVIPTNGGAVGPESFAFDNEGGGPYAGVSDGRIVKWLANETRWIDFAITTPKRKGCEGLFDHALTEQICGRPLGLSFNERTKDLYIADAYMGLLKVGSNGGLATPLVTEAQGIPFAFTNALDIDPRTGIVYFTDSSTIYPRRDYLTLVITGDNTGRLMKYDPTKKEVTVLLEKLMFPNGVSLSKNGKFLVVAETTNSRVLKYWLEPTKAGKIEVFARLAGFPDNIHRNQKGEFWVAINPNGQNVSSQKRHTKISYPKNGWAVKLSVKGEIVEILGDENENKVVSVSEVCERNGILWIGSVEMPYMVKLNV